MKRRDVCDDVRPVQGELVKPHGTHEGDVGESVVKQFLLLNYPQSSQALIRDLERTLP